MTQICVKPISLCFIFIQYEPIKLEQNKVYKRLYQQLLLLEHRKKNGNYSVQKLLRSFKQYIIIYYEIIIQFIFYIIIT